MNEKSLNLMQDQVAFFEHNSIILDIEVAPEHFLGVLSNQAYRTKKSSDHVMTTI